MSRDRKGRSRACEYRPAETAAGRYRYSNLKIIDQDNSCWSLSGLSTGNVTGMSDAPPLEDFGLEVDAGVAPCSS